MQKTESVGQTKLLIVEDSGQFSKRSPIFYLVNDKWLLIGLFLIASCAYLIFIAPFCAPPFRRLTINNTSNEPGHLRIDNVEYSEILPAKSTTTINERVFRRDSIHIELISREGNLLKSVTLSGKALDDADDGSSIHVTL